MVAAMTASIAHEIKQPLGAIVANANAGLRWLNRAKPAVEEALETLKDIVADGHRANDVIQSVRSMFDTRGQAASPLDINDLIRQTVAILQSELESAGVATRLALAPELPPVPVHRGQLQQVILNLLTNAAEAMRPVTDRERVLEVRSEPAGADGVAVAVEDTGPGIDATSVDRIFDAFYTTKSQGMGMGLAICRSIVEAHGGRLSVAMGEPHGSIFRFVLPGDAAGQPQPRS
jgi:signal transduction histidine kinase